ncbi:MAG: DUF4388 domain-containing protein [Pyrinomonadaceae bacterium]|nr:DUF4388 domain-containing protein [Pyrinomonadaceae bacterium]
MAIHGTLTTMSVPDLLQFLATGRKTGSLKFTSGRVVKQIHFEDGVIVGSFSNDPNEYFGQVLIHYGKLDEARLQVAMEVQRQEGGRLGEILISKGLASETDVLDILRTRTLEIIYDLFLWDEAQFEFFDSDPFPEDLIRISVHPTSVTMEGIYRVDEWARYRELIPSDRCIMELVPGWTKSLSVGKEVRMILYFLEKRITVAEICYNMHSSAFHVYAQLHQLVSEGVARVAGEAPKPPDASGDVANLPQTVSELLWAARTEYDEGKPERALPLIQKILEQEPKSAGAQALLPVAEEALVKQIYARDFSRQAVPKLLVALETLAGDDIGSQEGFMLSRINGVWDIESILSICPFRDADSLQMIKRLVDKGVIGF